MLSNSSITKVIEKDLDGGMICKSYFKPSDTKFNNINGGNTINNNSDFNKRVGSSSGHINEKTPLKNNSSNKKYTFFH